MGLSYYEDFKAKKQLQWEGNHPHRLPALRMSGTLNHEDDRRVTAGGLTATRTVVDLDFSLMATWTRVFREKVPLLALQTGLAEGTFGLFHRSAQFWSLWVSNSFGATPATVTIGTTTVYRYTRTTVMDPWVLDTTTTTDYDYQWRPVLFGGGDPSSGGKGPDNEDNSIRITAFQGGFPFLGNVAVYRLPWEDPWTSESTIYSDAFADGLATRNTASGGGHSGTCSATLHFTA